MPTPGQGQRQVINHSPQKLFTPQAPDFFSVLTLRNSISLAFSSIELSFTLL
jgi:hypothetical protein